MAKASSAPYGDIFYVQTPATDKLSDRLYQEQKYREIAQQQENKILDESMRKEFANVRSVDTPELVNSYNQYKTIKKQLYFDKKLQKDPVAFNKRQQEANAALQKTYEIINGSGELKDMAKNLVQERFKNPDDMTEDSGQRIGTLMNTPFSQVKNHPQYGDLTNLDAYKDQGPNYDFGEALHKAGGVPREILGKSIPIDKGLQTQTSVYQFGNTPAQVYDYLLNTTAINKAGRSAAKLWDKLPVAQIQSTIERYKQIPQEKWERMGIDAPQDLGNFSDNKADNYAKYLAMNYAINSEPKEGKPIIKENKSAIMAAQEARDRRMQAIRHADAKDLIKYKKDIDPNDTELNNVWYESHLKNLIEGAKSGEQRHMFKGNKSLGYYHVVKPDAFTAKAFARDIGEPDRIGVTASGEIIPIFYKYDPKTKALEKTSTGAPVINELYSQPMSYDQALINLGYRGATKKQLAADLNKPASAGKKAPSVNVEDLRKKYNY